MLHAVKRLIPSSLLDVYHRLLAWAADFWYGHPSQKMIVIGVTGTNGKTTTAYLIAKMLEAGGVKTGCTTTALIKVADREWLNSSKMTMMGRFALQKLLRQMVDAGCTYAVVETSSQGIVQHRHERIAYDVCVFTNLTPEHIEAHGGFENYKQAKIELFRHLASLPAKKIDGREVPRVSVLNADDAHAKDFAAAGVKQIIWYGTGENADIRATDIRETATGVSFDLSTVIPLKKGIQEISENDISDGSPGLRLTSPEDDMREDEGRKIKVNLKLMGRVNVLNVLAALSVAQAVDVAFDQAIEKLENIEGIPGRFERIQAGQSFTVLVDYAAEPEAVRRLYETVKTIPHEKIIHVLGSCGGGRDVARRPVMGKLAAENADLVVVTNEDPYDDDPREIMEDVARGAREAGKKDDVDLFVVQDRMNAIRRAMELAGPNDLVLLTGKGCETWICAADGKKLPWDEREAARQAIRETMG